MDNRKAEELRLKFYIGGEHQWHQEEVTARKAGGRPIVSINKCKPAVDQIEGDIRLNPPGPDCRPVGDGADDGTADIFNGLIRETEYRSSAHTAYSTAGKYSAASGYAVIELCSEYSSDRSVDQVQLRIDSVEDPHTVFFDPTARKANRQDAAWAGKLKMYTKSEYISAFGKDHAVLKSKWEQFTGGYQSAAGWISDYFGVDEKVTVTEWTGGGEGPFFVAEFYMVEIERRKLTMYDNHICYFEDENIPKGAKPLPGEQYTRIVPKRKIVKYVVDALEVLDGPEEWLGNLIPLFPVLGPEVYIDGKLHRLSLIEGAIDSQRALNYVATTLTELIGAMPKAPWVGPEGTFQSKDWSTANSETHAYLEYTPVFVTNEQGQQVLAPPPQRNMWEAAIQWAMPVLAFFSDAIKAVTAIYDPSLGQVKGDQSGKAIAQLRSESSVGTYSYSDNLHRAIEVMYQEMVYIFPKILDTQQVVAIVKADNQAEMVTINQDFSTSNGVDPKTGKKGKENRLDQGIYSIRVTVGPNSDTRQGETITKLNEFIHADPNILQAPGFAAQYLRILADGNPQVESLADLLDPNAGEEATPQQMQAQLTQSKQQVQALTKIAQELKQKLDAKLPQIEADRYKTEIDALVKLRVAEITASKDADNQKADIAASVFEQHLGMAHEVGMQAVEHGHQSDMADKAAVVGATQSAQDAAQQQEQQGEDNA